MFYAPYFAVAVSLLSLTSAQDNAIDIQAIQSHFKNAGIVPSVISFFGPTAYLSVNYAGVGDVTPGQSLKKEQVGPVPTLTVTPANSSVELGGNYTVAMIDAGIPGSDESQGVTRHWLINGATVTDDKVSNTSATAVANYAGPWPAAGSGPHRYVFLLFAQSTDFSAPSDDHPPTEVVNNWNFSQYITDSNLGPIVAVEEGQSTVSISPTSSVVSSTLSAPSNSQTVSNINSAPSETPSGSAASNTPLPLVVAFVVILFATLGSSL